MVWKVRSPRIWHLKFLLVLDKALGHQQKLGLAQPHIRVDYLSSTTTTPLFCNRSAVESSQHGITLSTSAKTIVAVSECLKSYSVAVDIDGRAEVHVSEWQRTTPRCGTGWYRGSSQVLCCFVNWGDLEQPTALVEPNDENPDAVVERPRLTTRALKKSLQMAKDLVNYYAFWLTSSWIGAIEKYLFLH